MLKRHSIDARIMHWFNTICWVLLLMTGIGLIDNPVMQPLGMWWVRAMQALFGNGVALLELHIAIGVVWSVGFLFYGIFRFKRITLPFVMQILTFKPINDSEWLIKKILSMTVGVKMMQRLGLKATIPDQGFYNAGQKIFAVCTLFGGLVIAISGWIMIYAQHDLFRQSTVQWAIMIHFLTAGLLFAGSLVHIYMAGIARGETPALVSMFTGKIPCDYASAHHKLWYESLQAFDKQQIRDSNAR